jgi:hypothetical protein
LLVSHATPAFAAAFALPVTVFIGLGALDVLRKHKPTAPPPLVPHVALLGFVGLPLVTACFKEPRAMDKTLAIVPLGLLLAAGGIRLLWQRGPRARLVVIAGVAAAVAQSLWWYGAVVR